MIGCVVCAVKNVNCLGFYSKPNLLVLECCHINPRQKEKIRITRLQPKIEFFLAAIIGFHIIYLIYDLSENYFKISANAVTTSFMSRKLLCASYGLLGIIVNLFRPGTQKSLLENAQAIIDNGYQDHNILLFRQEDEPEVHQSIVTLARIMHIDLICMGLCAPCLWLSGMITIEDAAVILEETVGCIFFSMAYLEHFHIMCTYNVIVKHLNKKMTFLAKTLNKTKQMRAVHRLYLAGFAQWDLLYQLLDTMLVLTILASMVLAICETRIFIYKVFEIHEYPFDQIFLVFVLGAGAAAILGLMWHCDTNTGYVSFLRICTLRHKVPSPRLSRVDMICNLGTLVKLRPSLNCSGTASDVYSITSIPRTSHVNSQ